MMSVTIKFKTGEVREFRHEGRPGGSYTKRVKYEGGFVIVVDEWYRQTAFPACDVTEVTTTGERY